MSSQHRAPETRRQYQVIADRVRHLIAEQGLVAGARLPAERELAQQLGVSRPSVREALIALEIEGWVEIRGGSGVYVCDKPGDGGETPSLGESPAELMQARLVLESAVVTLAAARATKEGLQRVEKALAAMREQHAQGFKPVEADRRFHISIAEMTGNAVLVELVGKLFDGRHSPLSARMSSEAESSPQIWRVALDEHEAIYRALEARSPQAAVAALGGHLQASQGRWVSQSAEAAERAVLAA